DSAVLAVSAVGYGLGVIGTAVLPFAPTLVLLVLAGIAWIGTLTVLNAALQLTLPQWVRARGASVYLLVFMGTMAIGSFLWGVVAQAIGAEWALVVSGIVLLLVGASVALWPLRAGTGTIDRTITTTWAEPMLVFEPAPTDGPVTIMRHYRVKEHDRAAFIAAMVPLRRSRERTGASNWRLYRSGEHADELLETFVVHSWGEFRRQRTSRLTGRDREYEDAASALLAEPATEEHFFPPPTITA
ncbi:MAG: transporter, partial [Microbacteriaceae bacterium]|nr:transporter [Microbacteriaceae bacterium]